MTLSDRRRCAVRGVAAASLAVVACVVVSAPAFADDPKRPPSIDQELSEKLLDDLSDDLLQGIDVDSLPKKPPDPKPGGDTRQNPGAQESDDALDLLGPGEDLGAAGAGNPLARIGEAMQKVEGRLGAGDTSDGTQSLQRQIIDALAKLIERNSKSNSSSRGASSSQSKSASSRSGESPAGSQAAAGASDPGNSPARDSTNRLGQAESQEARRRQMEALFKQAWGHLPERIRDEMESAASERFLPKYEKIIEEYFRRLANENAGASAEP
jgi:hypothetical protein